MAEIKVMSIDIESFSDVNLKKCGVYKYSESPNFEILLFGYSVNGGAIQVVDLACGEKIPADVLAALEDETVTKWAYNANFERVCLSRFLGFPTGEYLDPASWKCSQVWAAYLGLPSTLKDVGAVLKLENQKIDEGSSLISYFCVPCKPTKANGGRTRNLPKHDMEKWTRFKAYNLRDVEVEMAIQQRLSKFPVPDSVWEEYHIDQEINDRGIGVDMAVVENAIKFDERSKAMLSEKMQELTNLDNPNSVQQLQKWLVENGLEMDSLGKKEVAQALKTAPEPLQTVLSLRLQLAKSSVKKYTAMRTAVCKDSRAKGMFKFYGANRTGRFCLAESTPVLVKDTQGRVYEKPIEDVLKTDLVFDGENWVQHEGVVFSGEKEVIEWDGIIATPEHQVFIDKHAKIPLGMAREMKLALWEGEKPTPKRCLKTEGGVMRTYDIINAGPNNRFMANGRIVSNSGKIIQLQNLPQNHIPDLEQARELVRGGDYDALAMLYGDVPDTLSQLVRTAFVPQYGRKFIVSDFSAIEARVIAWVAGEKWRLKVFEDGGDIYCASASQMFKVPVEKHGINGHLRQKGKIAELALGYGGSVGALTAMGALEMGLSEDELQPLVDSWREANPNIVRFWWDIDRAVKECIKTRSRTETHGLKFDWQSGMLFITLFSGRRLAYVKPKIGENRFGGESVTYMGIGENKKWQRLESYGPKFVENCVAAGTLVVTQRGLIPIEEITDADLLWDGCEWCHHEGLIAKGKQTVVKVNGIYLTPEHRILTVKGWMECAKSSGFNWAAFSLPDSFVPCREHETGQSPVVVPVRLRKAKSYPCPRSHVKDNSRQVVRVYAKAADLGGINTARHESSSRIRCVALHEAEMRGPETSRLSQLRRSGNHGLQGMERELRGVLEGYGADISARAGLRQNQQQRGLPAWKLPVDHPENQHTQQTYKPCDRYPIWQDDGICAGGADRHWRDNAHIPTGSRLADRITVHETGLQKPVYDIRNCGPRHRFAVWDEEVEKVRVVSNCVQAISRDILCYAMRTLRNCDIVAHVHDELVIEADRDMSLEAVCEQMGRTPPWAKGLKLRADGYEGEFYRKD